jgi:4-amino-4-deoxy-L-arabinose transferase-like glycosyltransferase
MRPYFKLDKQELLILLIFFVIAFLLRLCLFKLEPIVQPDGIAYSISGYNLISGNGYVNYSGEYMGKYAPIYPILIGIANLFIKDITFAGAFISMLFGSLLVFPLFLFASNMFNKTIGYISAFVALWYPCLTNNASTALTSATYIFFFCTSAYLAWIALKENRAKFYILCGLFAGLTYLVRIEIIGYFLVFILFLILTKKKRCFPGVVLLIGVFLLVAIPFHLYNLANIGSPLLFGKILSGTKYLERMNRLGLSEFNPGVISHSIFAFLKMYLKGVDTMYRSYLPQIFPPLLLMIVAVGIIERFRRQRRFFDDTYLVSLVILTMLCYQILRPSGRNLIYSLPFLIILLSSGIYELRKIIVQIIGFENRPLRYQSLVLIAMLFIIFILVVPQTLRPLIMGPDPKSPIEMMEMGRWIKRNLPAQKYLMAIGSQAAFYAGCIPVKLPLEYDEIIKKANEYNLNYIIVGNYKMPSEIKLYMLLEEIKRDSNLRFVHEIKERSGWVRLYELVR